MYLQVTRADGSVNSYEITPAIEYAFELTHKKSYYKTFREEEKQSDLYWLAWECVRRSGQETVKPFGMEFVESLKSVEILPDDPNG